MMPAKSKAQMKYLFAAAARGEVKKSVAEDFAVSGKRFKQLPERVKAAKHHGREPQKHSDD